MRPARRLRLIDLVAVVGAAGVGLAMIRWLAPGQLVPMTMVIAPLVGVAVDRWSGGRGILGGLLGGTVHGVFWTALLYVGAAVWGWPIGHPLMMLFGVAASVAFGAVLGVIAWLFGSLGGRRARPDTSQLV